MEKNGSSFDEWSENHRWFRSNYQKLARKYDGQNVCIYKRQVVARKDFVMEYILPLAPFILNNPTEEAWMRLQSEIRKTRKRVTAGEVLKELERVETPS